MARTILKLETTTFVVELKRAMSLKNLHDYWIVVEHKRILNPTRIYTSLYYPKFHAFRLFLKIAGKIINEKYISY